MHNASGMCATEEEGSQPSDTRAIRASRGPALIAGRAKAGYAAIARQRRRAVRG